MVILPLQLRPHWRERARFGCAERLVAIGPRLDLSLIAAAGEFERRAKKAATEVVKIGKSAS
jgi:hypothetical protein